LKNTGKGFAVKAGFERCSGDIVVFLDSDLEIGFEQILRCVEALQYGDIAIASKNHPESVVSVPVARRILSFGFNMLTRWLTGMDLKDTQTGLKAMRRSALEKVLPHMTVKRFAFDVELLTIASLHGLKIVETPVDLCMDGSFRLKEAFRMFIDLLGIAYRLRITHTYRPAQHKSETMQIMRPTAK
jgi:glycosyltransferase involved in cell wall biosynthesis